MDSVQSFQTFIELLKADKLTEACVFLSDLSDETLTSFTRSYKVRAIEVLKKPDPDYIKNALVNQEWLTAEPEHIDTCLLEARDSYRERGTETPEKTEADELIPKKGRKPRKRQVKLADLENSSEPAVEKPKKKRGRPSRADKEKAAAAALAEKQKLEEEPEKPVERPPTDDISALKEKMGELESTINEQNNKMAAITEGITAVLAEYDGLIRTQKKLADIVQNSHKSLTMKQEKLWKGFCTLAAWTLNSDLDTVLEGLSVVGKVIDEKVDEPL